MGDYTGQTWGSEDLDVEELLRPFPGLDEQVRKHLEIGIEVQPWRLWVQYVNRLVILAKDIFLIGVLTLEQ